MPAFPDQTPPGADEAGVKTLYTPARRSYRSSMKNRIARSIRMLALASLLVASSHAAAQISGPSGGMSNQAPPQGQQQNRGVNRAAPPLPPATDSLGVTSFLYYALIVVLGGAVIVVSVMPGKRGHQD